MVTQTNAQSNLSLIQRAKLAHKKDLNDARWQRAKLLVETVKAVLDVDIPSESVDWSSRDGRFEPYVVIEGYSFSYFADAPPRLYVGLPCTRCEVPVRTVIGSLGDLGAELEAVHYCKQHLPAAEREF